MNEMGLKAYKCKKCGRLHNPKHLRCLSCKSRDFDETEVKGNAKLVTFTQLFNLPWGFDERFLMLGIAQFGNGVRALGQIKAGDASELKLGMQLKPSWELIRILDGEEVYGLRFEPIRTA